MVRRTSENSLYDWVRNGFFDGSLLGGGTSTTTAAKRQHCTAIKVQPIIGINLLVCTIAWNKKRGK